MAKIKNGTRLFVAAGICGFLTQVQAESAAVGVVIVSSGSVKAVGSSTRPLTRGSKIYSGDRIITSDNSSAEIRYTDNGSISLNSNTEYQVDKYHYTGPKDTKSSSVSTLVRGKMLAVTGAISNENHGEYAVKSKVATIGVTGTKFSTRLYNSGRGAIQTLIVYQGTVVFRSNKGYTIKVGDHAPYRAAIVSEKSPIPLGYKPSPARVMPAAAIQNVTPAEPISAIQTGGAYVDIGLSHNISSNQFQQSFSANGALFASGPDFLVGGPISPTGLSSNLNSSASGWDGFMGAGYSFAWNNNWSLGIELFAALSSTNGTQYQASFSDLITGINQNYSEVLRLKSTYGASIFPGFYVAPGSLYFFELGYVNSSFDLSGNPKPYTPTVYPTTSPGVSLGVELSGFRLGFGNSTQLGSHLAIRQEYVWESYGHFSASQQVMGMNVPANFLDLNFNLNTSIYSQTSNEKYNIAAVYYFAPQANAPDLNLAPSFVGSNFYVGIEGSRVQVESEAVLKTNISSLDMSENTAAVNNIQLNPFGWNVGFLAGYGFNFSNRLYAGIEVFGDYDNVSGRFEETQAPNPGLLVDGFPAVGASSATYISARLQKNWGFGFAFLPGYQVTNFALLFARVGYLGSEFNIVNFASLPNATLAGSTSKWLSGLQLGLGVDTALCKNLSLRSEFDINNYDSLSLSNAQTTATFASFHKNVVEDTFKVGLIWRLLPTY